MRTVGIIWGLRMQRSALASTLTLQGVHTLHLTPSHEYLDTDSKDLYICFALSCCQMSVQDLLVGKANCGCIPYKDISSVRVKRREETCLNGPG